MAQVPALPAYYYGPCDVTVGEPDDPGAGQDGPSATLPDGFTYVDPYFLMGMWPNPPPGGDPDQAFLDSLPGNRAAPILGEPGVTLWFETPQSLSMLQWLLDPEGWPPTPPYEPGVVDEHREALVAPILYLDPIHDGEVVAPPGVPADLADPAFVAAFTEQAVNMAFWFRPAYLMIGSEVNEHDAAPGWSFAGLVTLYEHVYDAVKQEGVSPHTRVFPSFDYERIQTSPEGWAPVEAFDPDKLDLLGLSTSPADTYGDPAAVPDDYYSRIKLHATLGDKPVGFVGIHWPTDGASQAAEEQKQVDFLDRFFDALTPTLHKPFVVYSPMHDFEDEQDVERKWGLKRADGSPKPAWSRWLEIAARPFDPADSPAAPSAGFHKGFLPNPGDDHPDPLEDPYDMAGQNAHFVPLWPDQVGEGEDFPAPTVWNFAVKLLRPRGSDVLGALVRGNGLFPLIQLSFIDGGYGAYTLKTPEDWDEHPEYGEASLSNPYWRAFYKEAVLDVVRVARPLYLSVGNEVNKWYEQQMDPAAALGPENDFEHFVSLYEEIRDGVKALSPTTRVYCVIARETVARLCEADLDVLDLFDPATLDVVVFTSYPFTVKRDRDGNPLPDPIHRPSDVPADYYASALADRGLAGKPLGFTEIGWPSENGPFGGEQAQADFLSVVPGALTADQGLDLRLLGWPWLHDLAGGDSHGLIERDGTAKTAFGVWGGL